MRTSLQEVVVWDAQDLLVSWMKIAVASATRSRWANNAFIIVGQMTRGLQVGVYRDAPNFHLIMVKAPVFFRQKWLIDAI